MEYRATIDQLKNIIREMEKASQKYPDLAFYYDWEDEEIKFTVPVSSKKSQQYTTNRDELLK